MLSLYISPATFISRGCLASAIALASMVQKVAARQAARNPGTRVKACTTAGGNSKLIRGLIQAAVR